MPHWNDLKPLYLAKQHKGHPWIFALYTEYPSDRGDQSSHYILLFRDKDRTVFGMKEINDMKNYKELRRLATRVVIDKTFRQSLITADPSVTKLWKKH